LVRPIRADYTMEQQSVNDSVPAMPANLQSLPGDGVLFYSGHGSVAGHLGDHLMIAPPNHISGEQIDVLIDYLHRATVAEVDG
jgi:cell wall-associated NlpC family hydrolase